MTGAIRAGGLLGAIVNDWTLSGIVTLQSGMPFAVTQATNTNAFAGFGTQRPNLVGDPTLPADERSRSRWFNTSAFAAAPQFTLGSASRNPVRGPAYRNVDIGLARRLPLRLDPRRRTPRRDLQRHQHAAARHTERRVRLGRVRDDHHGRRPARRATGGEVPVLTGSPAWAVNLSSPAAYYQ